MKHNVRKKQFKRTMLNYKTPEELIEDKDKKPVTVSLDRKVYNGLKKIVRERERLTVSDVVNEACRGYLEHLKSNPP